LITGCPPQTLASSSLCSIMAGWNLKERAPFAILYHRSSSQEWRRSEPLAHLRRRSLPPCRRGPFPEPCQQPGRARRQSSPKKQICAARALVLYSAIRAGRLADMSTKLFSELGISADVLKGIDRLGFEKASPIQAESIPPLMEGKDVVG